MDEEDKNLLKELASIMQRIEQKGLLELVNANISDGIVPDIKEKESDGKSHEQELKNIWNTFYDSSIDPDFKIAHGGKTLCLVITMSKKRSNFFSKLSSYVSKGDNFMFNLNGVKNAIGLVKISNTFSDESEFPSPVPLPGKLEDGTYLLCRICFGGKGYKRSLKIYFSKAWSGKISGLIDIVHGQKFAIDKIWTLENTSKVLLPCKAVYRWESSNELVINAPPWLGLVGATKKGSTSIWIRYRDDDGNVTRGHLSKRGKGNTLFRCSRKEPWDFYQSMKKKKTSKIETGVIDFMVAFDPETVF
tara:strand:+ start:277 stop:1188 length:912 start_codon:yes stop_codon:yes gene_type:complete